MNVSVAACVRLRESIVERLKPYTGAGPFALVDFPNHANVGDSAIWLGELAYFKAMLGSPPAYVCACDSLDADALRRAVPERPIFLHGGGNFGDIWPWHHEFRMSILAEFPDRRVVQLPQTIHFTNAHTLQKTAKAIEEHGSFVLCVRDRRSFDTATSSFACPVHLVPDMAFCIDGIARPVSPTHPLVLLLRTDSESARRGAAALMLPMGAIVADWLEEDPTLYSKQKRYSLMHSLPALGLLGVLSKPKQRELLFRNLAHHRLSRGIHLLSSAEFVITDRLHSHILCVLLGIPHIVFDNSYGKLSTFIDAWTKDCGLVQIVPSLEHAIARWSELQTS